MTELITQLEAKRAIVDAPPAELAADLELALETLDKVGPYLHRDDEDIRYIVKLTRADLIDAYLAFALGQEATAFRTLRGVMEGLLSAVYYREQRLSLGLWARGKAAHMVHQFFTNSHEFRLYFKLLMEDEVFKSRNPGVTCSAVFATAEDLYDNLSTFIHKKRSRAQADFSHSAQDVFRVALTFLDATDELEDLHLKYPTPLIVQPAGRPQNAG